jgi:hypothetical protein
MYEEPLLDKRVEFEDGAAPGKTRHLQQQDDEEDLGVVIHQLNSFFAVLWPVSTAIICSR